MIAPRLTAEAISLQIGDALILDAISHAFSPGKITALLGPNGAGKSSLLACLAGLRNADTGQAMLGDAPLHTLDRRARARAIGFLPQVADVHWDIDVETLVGLGRFAHAQGWGMSAGDRHAIADAMLRTDVTRFAGRVVNTLSGGERARVLLARVLAGQPQWLLADEPLASLDPAHQLDVLALLRETADAGTGVILVVHDLGQALRIADEVVLLRAGHRVAAGACAEVLTVATIARAYGVTVEMGTTPDGTRFIVPATRLAALVA